MSQIPLAFATCSLLSLSNEDSSLPRKLQAIRSAGFKAIELEFSDLQGFASKFLGRGVAPDDYESLCIAAREVARLCGELGLEVLMLQPFANFEGWPRGTIQRHDAFRKTKGWMSIMKAAGTDMLQIGSTDAPAAKISTSRSDIVEDLRELADIMAQQNMRIAYENWCWSTHAPKWSDVWDIVKRVDRPNVGLCLDTFQTAGSEWADPTMPCGLVDGGKQSQADGESLDKRFAQSLEELSSSIPPEKIYLLQISDAYKPQPQALEKQDINGARPRARWSHDFRPLPYHGGYLPVEDVTRAVLRTGFRGWFSVEVFDGGPRGEGKECDMQEYARMGKGSVDKLIENSSPQ